MDEDTTTASDSIDLGDVETSQPSTVVEPTDAAATSPEPTTTETTTTEPEAAPATDDNSEWLKNKGIDPTSPEAVAKLAEMARNAEKRMHEATQPKLNEALTNPVDESLSNPLIEQPDVVSELTGRLAAIETERNVERFFAANGNTEQAAERRALEPQMAQIVTDNPAINQMVKAGYMSYDQLFALAKGSDPTYGSKLKQDGGREALQTVATKQQGRAVQGVATTSAVSGDSQPDAFLDGFNSI